jgi:hypothetical protein
MLPPEDRREIRELVDTYAVLVDSKDYEGVSQLFLPDGCLVAPEPPVRLTPERALQGCAEIKRELSQLDAFSLTFHGVLGLLITRDGDDSATGQVNAVAHHVRVGGRGAQDLVWHLRYLDNYVRTADGWRFASRRITIELIDSRPVKLAGGVVAKDDGPAAHNDR